MAADSNAIKAGATYVEIFTKNNVGPGLAAANAEMSQFAATQSAQLTTEGKAAVAQQAAQSRLGKYADKFLTVAASVIAVKHAYEGLWQALGGEMAVERLNTQMERAVKINDRLAETVARQRAEQKDWLGVGDRKQQATNVGAALENEMKNLGGQGEALTRARAALEKATTERQNMEAKGDVSGHVSTGGDFTWAGNKLGLHEATGLGDLKRKEEEATARVTELEARHNATLASTIEKRKKLNELNDPSKDLALANATAGLAITFSNYASTVGLTAEQLEILKLRQQGVNDEMLKGAGVMDKAREATNRRLSDQARQLYLDFREQSDAIGLSPQAAQLQKLKREIQAGGGDTAALGSARLAAIGSIRKQAGQDIQDINDEVAEKARRAMLSFQGSTKGVFGGRAGAGGFDFGGGGQWQTSVVGSLKDMREVDFRIEKVLIDMNKNVQKIQADQYQ